ncbi:hypothetical protein I2I05_02480 [Hymenobacter sp. BT683]|uniref:Phytanoyl-CoA dioxygenase family protein n=1 Tax=Hymenobacter jeongseonensis TaxID=2791027 RepID=A0ABS0ID27_9BACT|nr:hypothetical protein [Hymenobacter jeongseonensis]MBF9236252.1 hypothetical protein [Hymenobacter jeongseonensis]
MMNTIFFDSPLADDERRAQLYQGQLFAFQPRASVLALVNYARELTEAAFGDLDPETAQHAMSASEFDDLLATFKPEFINSARTKQLMQNLLRDFGCDPEKTYFDVPRLRSATSHDFLVSGMAHRFETHRDSWFSACLSQLNWWFPVYAHESGNAVAFHPAYWHQAVPNGSEHYHMKAWFAEGARLKAAGEPDQRPRPEAYKPLEADPQIRLVLPPGGVTIFAGAQMHSTVHNETGKTRWSIDFRTVHLDDLLNHRGAPNLDSRCTGTNLVDFYRVSDLARLPQDIISRYEPGTPLLADLSQRTQVPQPSLP